MRKEIKSYFEITKNKILEAPNKATIKSLLRHSKEFIRSINEMDVDNKMKKYSYNQYKSVQLLAKKRLKFL